MPRSLTAAFRDQHKERRSLSPKDFSSACYAAAKLSLRGDAWKPEDWADCAAHVAAVRLAQLAGDRSGETGPDLAYDRRAGKLVHVGQTATEEKARTVDELGRWSDAGGNGRQVVAYLRRAELVGPGMLAACDAVPYWAGNLHALQQIASKWRRSVEAQRRRDADESKREKNRFPLSSPSTVPGSHPRASEIDERRGTPWGARTAAVEMLRAAGLMGDRIPKGPLWTLAYTAARASAGLESREIADELEISFPLQRKHVERAAERLAASGHGIPDWAEALAIEAGVSLKATASRSASADLESGWRGKDSAGPAPAPVVVKVRKLRPRKRPAGWSTALPETTKRRLAAAAENRRKREAMLSPEEREQRRHEAGIPPLPRGAAA